MEIEGKIIVAMPEQGGTSARTGNAWKSQDFVIETHDQYPRKCVFRVFGADRLAQFNIQVGEELRVSFDIDAHEYQGRWFNDIRAYRVDRIDPATIGQQPMAMPGAFPPPPPAGAYAQPAAPYAQQAAPYAQPAAPYAQPAAPAPQAPAPQAPAPQAPQPEMPGESTDDLPF